MARTAILLSIAMLSAVAAVGCGATAPTSMETTVRAGPTSTVAVDRLTIEEHPIVAQSEDRPDHLEYSRRIDPKILDKRRAWRGFARQGWVGSINGSLARFGYRLVGRTQSDSRSLLCDLHRGDDVVLHDVATVWPIALNARGDDFALVVEARQSGQFLIRPSGVEKWESMEHAFTRPVFVENDLVTLDLREDHGLRLFGIVRAGRPVYASAQVRGPVSEPIKGLGAWDGHWVLEVDEEVLVDGRSLGEEMGYDEVFGWQLLKGEPFHFFRKGKEIGVSCAGQELPNRYEEVIHYMCCEPAHFNAAGNDIMVWFHALKDGTWHYVEMGVFDE